MDIIDIKCSNSCIVGSKPVIRTEKLVLTTLSSYSANNAEV